MELNLHYQTFPSFSSALFCIFKGFYTDDAFDGHENFHN